MAGFVLRPTVWCWTLQLDCTSTLPVARTVAMWQWQCTNKGFAREGSLKKQAAISKSTHSRSSHNHFFLFSKFKWSLIKNIFSWEGCLVVHPKIVLGLAWYGNEWRCARLWQYGNVATNIFPNSWKLKSAGVFQFEYLSCQDLSFPPNLNWTFSKQKEGLRTR